MHVGLLECDHVEQRFRSIAGGYPEMFSGLLGAHLSELRWSCFDVCHGELPPAPETCEAYVCTGSRFSVYEPLPWIEALKNFLHRLREARIPFVGICFGHQVLAEAFGGKVAPSPAGWVVGVEDFDVLGGQSWMEPPLARCSLQHMHQDQVSVLPAGALLLGRGDHCEVEMFALGTTLLGIEAHPEFPAAYNEALIRDRAERIGRERAQAGLASLARPTDQAVVGRWIAKFLREPRS